MSATLSSTNPPPSQDYGGDEISALVLDPGYTSMRAGFAGEDYPKSITPMHYGVIEFPNAESRLVIGENAIHNPLPNLDIRHPMMTDGTVEVKDPDVVKKLFEYSIVSKLVPSKPSSSIRNGDTGQQDSKDMDTVMENAESSEEGFLADTPLLLTDLDYLTGKARDDHIQYVFEEWGCPAYWGGKQSVLATFSAGKPSALVIDIGASKTTVSPVLDGMALRKGVRSSPYAGNFVSDQVRALFAKSQPPVPLTPHYLVASKTPVDAGAPAQAILKTFPHGSPLPSFRLFQEERVITEFKEVVLMARPKFDHQKDIMGKTFEMPDGYNQIFGAERTKPVEALFDTNAIEHSSSFPTNHIHTLTSLINSSLQTIDIDTRPTLLFNVVVVGGTSLIQSLGNRIGDEISALLPGAKVRVYTPNNYAERRYASWIGGSILASLGSFHQMWVSKKEYEEYGASALHRRLG